MKIIITGSTGLIGSALVSTLLAEGHQVTRFVRDETQSEREDGTRAVGWNPQTGRINKEELEAHDAVIHLAGESVAEGKWTNEKKRRIRESRVYGTSLLANTIKEIGADGRKPQVFVCASAIGYYGNRGDEILDESSASGSDFLASVVREWEAAAEPVRDAGVRLVFMRFGVVLSPQGGALAKLLTPFKLGAGGRIGSGEQYMSWIAIDDAVGAILHALHDENFEGAANTVAPHPVTNAGFTETLGRVLNRPTLLNVPAFAARLAFGEMADAVLLAGQRVLPKKLEASNYKFKYPRLEVALRHLLST